MKVSKEQLYINCISNAVDTIETMDKETDPYNFAKLNILLAIALNVNNNSSNAVVASTSELVEEVTDAVKEEKKSLTKEDLKKKAPVKHSKKEKVEEEQKPTQEEKKLLDTLLLEINDIFEAWQESDDSPSSERVLSWVKMVNKDAEDIDYINKFTYDELVTFYDFIKKWKFIYELADESNIECGIEQFSTGQLTLDEITPDNIDALVDFFEKALQEEE